MNSENKSPEDILHQASEITDPSERNAYQDVPVFNNEKHRNVHNTHYLKVMLIRDSPSNSINGTPAHSDTVPEVPKPYNTKFPVRI